MTMTGSSNEHLERMACGGSNALESDLANGAFSTVGSAPTFGSKVQISNARSIELVYSAINLLVSSLSTLPMSLLGNSDSGRVVLNTHWAHYRVHTEPYPGWIPARWFGAFWMNALLFGNACGYVDRAERRFKLIPWHQVNHDRRVGEDRYYIGDGSVWLPASEVVHVQAPSVTGNDGDSPVVKCSKALNVSMSAEDFADKFYRQAVGLGGYIKSDKDIAWEASDREKFIESFRRQFSGPQNAGKAGILPPGAEYVDRKPMHREAQHVESALHQTRVVARIFSIPPHKLGDDSKTSYSSLEQEQMRYVVDGLRPWMVRGEQEFTLKALTPTKRRQGCKFLINAAALLRGDEKTRAEVHKTYVSFGGKTINEVRAKEDLGPVEGGDQILVPSNNMQPLAAVTGGESEDQE